MSDESVVNRDFFPSQDSKRVKHSFMSVAFVAILSVTFLTIAAFLSMFQALALPLPQIKTVFILFHIIGLVLGMGAAFLLDLFLLRYTFFRPVDQSAIDVARFGSKIVSLGLGLLWVTGLGFLCIYAVSDPSKLSNLKIYAKITIVAVLTINGALIHFLILPSLERRIGKTLWQARSIRAILLDIYLASISFVCWISATFLGVSKEMNFAADYSDYMIGFLCVLTGAIGVAIAGYLLLTLFNRNPRSDYVISEQSAVTRLE